MKKLTSSSSSSTVSSTGNSKVGSLDLVESALASCLDYLDFLGDAIFLMTYPATAAAAMPAIARPGFYLNFSIMLLLVELLRLFSAIN